MVYSVSYNQVMYFNSLLYGEYSNLFASNLKHSFKDEADQRLEDIQTVLKTLENASMDNEHLQMYSALESFYRNLTEFDYIAIRFARGVPISYFQDRILSDTTTAIVLELQRKLDDVLSKSENAVESFLEQSQKTLKYLAAIDILKLEMPKNFMLPAGVNDDELFHASLKDLRERAEEFWVYGVINGCDWV